MDASVNSSISKEVYLGEDNSLHYVTVEDMQHASQGREGGYDL